MPLASARTRIGTWYVRAIPDNVWPRWTVTETAPRSAGSPLTSGAGPSLRGTQAASRQASRKGAVTARGRRPRNLNFIPGTPPDAQDTGIWYA
jgi:hypothetical protein